MAINNRLKGTSDGGLNQEGGFRLRKTIKESVKAYTLLAECKRIMTSL